MMTAAEKQTLRVMLERYEGKISHMYLDANGYVTIGVGHLIGDVVAAQRLAFRTAKNLPASATDITADYNAVKRQPANRVAAFYRKHTKLVLPIPEVDRLTGKHIESFERELESIYSGFSAFPSEVRLALFDLIFNLGMTNLKNKWPVFNAAIAAKDWQKAADNSGRSAPVSSERNRYVKDLLEAAAKSARIGKP